MNSIVYLENKNIIIVMNLFILFFIFVLKKRRSFDLVVLLVGFYAISFISSLVFYNASLVNHLRLNNINLTSLLCISGLLLIGVLPWMSLNEKNYIIILNNDNNNTQLKMISIVAVLLGFCSIVPLMENLISLKSFNINSFANAYIATSEGTAEKSRFFIFYRLLYFFQYWGAPIFFWLLPQRKNNQFCFFFSAIWLINYIITPITSGSRGSLINNFILIVFSFFMIKSNYPINLIKGVKKISIILLVFLTIVISLITVSRMDARTDGTNLVDNAMLCNVTLYLGEGPLRFSQYMWDNDIKTEGDNTMPLLKCFIGDNCFKHNQLRRDFWSTRKRIPNHIFYTYAGDFVSDFGFWGTLFIFIIAAFILYLYIAKITKGGYLLFEHVIILSIFFQTTFLGVMTFNNKVYDRQILIAFTFFSVFLFSQIPQLCKRKMFIDRIW